MAERNLILWRHGRTVWNKEQRFQGQTDVPLDEVGVAQAQRAAQLLQHLAPHHLVSSDLQRAYKTAEELARLTNLEIAQDSDFRETAHGEWEGKTYQELQEKYGEVYSRWSTGTEIRPGDTGETRIEVATRMVRGIHRYLPEIEDGGTLVVATHGGAARAAVAQLLDLPKHLWGNLGILANCSWVVLQEAPSLESKWRLIEYNAGSLPIPALSDDR